MSMSRTFAEPWGPDPFQMSIALEQTSPLAMPRLVLVAVLLLLALAGCSVSVSHDDFPFFERGELISDPYDYDSFVRTVDGHRVFRVLSHNILVDTQTGERINVPVSQSRGNRNIIYSGRARAALYQMLNCQDSPGAPEFPEDITYITVCDGGTYAIGYSGELRFGRKEESSFPLWRNRLFRNTCEGWVEEEWARELLAGERYLGVDDCGDFLVFTTLSNVHTEPLVMTVVDKVSCKVLHSENLRRRPYRGWGVMFVAEISPDMRYVVLVDQAPPLRRVVHLLDRESGRAVRLKYGSYMYASFATEFRGRRKGTQK